jgi:hypothetical protein
MNSIATTNLPFVFAGIWVVAFLFQLLSDFTYRRMAVREVIARPHLTKTASYVTTIVLVILACTLIMRLGGAPQ